MAASARIEELDAGHYLVGEGAGVGEDNASAGN
jgi:hypothetical protein